MPQLALVRFRNDMKTTTMRFALRTFQLATPSMKALTAFSAALALVSAAAAQTWSSPMSPRATYVRTNNDSPLSPVILDLAAFGAVPGQWLRVQSTGAYTYINGQDINRAMCGVFSASTTLLPSNVQQRVVDAIPAGPSFGDTAQAVTFYGSLPVNIPQDFYVSRIFWGDFVDVQIPPGATYLFLGTMDSYYADNVDPNGDWGVTVTVIPTPTFPGTGEHITMKTAVNGTPAFAPDLHLAPVGSTITAELEYPLGLIDNSLYIFLADVTAIGAPPPNPLPGLWSQNLIALKAGVLPSTPNFTDTWSLVVAPGYSGTAIFVQCAALANIARNGLFETTNAHVFLFP